MSIKRLSAIGLALTMVANAAFGAGVQYFKSGETPDPRHVARVLSQRPSAPPLGLKLRSIRLMSPDEKAVDATGAERPVDPIEPAKSAGRVALVAEGPVPASDLPPAIVAAPVSVGDPAVASTSALAGSHSMPVTADSPASSPVAVARVAKAEELPTSLALPVQFAFDSARILPTAYRQLDAVAEGIKLARPDARIVIEGHTDSVGSDKYNLRLSAERAYAVYDYLVLHHGVNPARLRVVGMGKFAPLDKARPAAPENRRVEFRAEA